MRTTHEKLVAPLLIVAAFTFVYWRVLADLVEAWNADGNYSHGFLIVPVAGYLAWERRDKLHRATLAPAWSGLVVLAAALSVFVTGILGAEFFLSRISIIGAIAGIIVFMFGWTHLRILAFPLAFLFLMIPIPVIVFNQVAFPLQLFASRLGEAAIASANIPVLREGNVLVLASTTLEVAEACSGIRSLVSLLTIGVIYGYFADRRMWVRVAITSSALPVAIAVNGARVAGTGIAAHFYGPAAAEGFLHELSGWMMFIVAFLMMLAFQRLLLRIAPVRDLRLAGSTLESTT